MWTPLMLLLAAVATAAAVEKLPDHYKTLGVKRGASDKEIKKQFRKLAKKWHPDKNSDPRARGKMEAINEAYSTLSDDTKREEYERMLEDSHSRAAPNQGFQQHPHGFQSSGRGGERVFVFSQEGGGMPGGGMPRGGMPGGMPGGMHFGSGGGMPGGGFGMFGMDELFGRFRGQGAPEHGMNGPHGTTNRAAPRAESKPKPKPKPVPVGSVVALSPVSFDTHCTVGKRCLVVFLPQTAPNGARRELRELVASHADIVGVVLMGDEGDAALRTRIGEALGVKVKPGDAVYVRHTKRGSGAKVAVLPGKGGGSGWMGKMRSNVESLAAGLLRLQTVSRPIPKMRTAPKA